MHLPIMLDPYSNQQVNESQSSVFYFGSKNYSTWILYLFSALVDRLFE